MKFALLSSCADTFSNFRGQLISDLLNLGYEVHLIGPEMKNGDWWRRRFFSDKVFIHNVPLQRTGLNPWRDIRTLWCLYHLLKDIRPDYLLAYTVQPVVYGILAAWLARVPKRFALITGLGVAFTLADQKGLKQQLISSVVPYLYKVALKRADLIFFQNPDDQRLFETRGIVPRSVRTALVNGSG